MTEFLPLQQPQIHPDAFIADTARIHGDVAIGRDASVWFGVSIRAEEAPAAIGAGSNVQDNVVIHTDEGFPVVIGTNVTIGHAAIVHGAVVEDDALVGMGSILLNGAVVERGALVAAGTVVPPGGRVPAGMVAVGSPMRLIREVRESENESTGRGLRHYQHYARVYKAMADQEG